MALFENDLIAIIVLVVVAMTLYFIGKIINLVFVKTEKISIATKIKGLFVHRILSFVIIIYLIMEGFPILGQVPTEYKAIITGSVSTAVAFASSGVFTNIVSGIALLLMRPFDVGDLIMVEGQTGVVRTIKLTKVVIETFDNVRIVKSNSDIISNNITNYTLDFNKMRQFVDIKDKIHYAENLFPSMITEEEQSWEIKTSVKKLLQSTFMRKQQTKVHNFIFTMEVEYDRLLVKLDKIESLCKKYTDIFNFKPRYHVAKVMRDLTLRFRILTPDTDLLFKYQPEFANELYKIIREPIAS